MSEATGTRTTDIASPTLEMSNVFIQYGRGSKAKDVVENLTLEVPRGRTVALVGESGSGKTTTVRAALNLIAPRAGSVRVNGRPVREWTRAELAAAVQFVPQDTRGSLDPRHTVLSSLVEPLTAAGGMRRKPAERLALERLEECGLSRDYADYRPFELSGGQIKRVCLARALAVSPSLLIADEPTAGLDVSVQATVLALIRDLQTSNRMSILIVTHDLAVVRQLADHVAVMNRGRIVEQGPVGDVLDAPTDPYTAHLLESAPERDFERRIAERARVPESADDHHHSSTEALEGGAR